MCRVWFAGLLLAASLSWAAPAKKVVIASATLHQSEDGSPLVPGHEFVPGETIFFGFQVGGYQADEERKIHLEYSLEALDAKGVPVVPPIKSTIETTLSDEDKNWLPKERQSFVLPSYIEPGAYQIVLSVRDILSKSEAKGTYSIPVRGRSVAPSDTLVIRNLRFLRTEDDQAPLTVIAYRQGDAVWARFEITGYKFGPGNAMEVGYGVAVLRPNGQQLYAEPNAAQEKEQSFYPRRYMPGIISLTLTKDIAVGEYTLVVTARDGVGNQNCEIRSKFRVE